MLADFFSYKRKNPANGYYNAKQKHPPFNHYRGVIMLHTSNSCEIIHSAIQAHIAATGCKLKDVAYAAGFEMPNYLSMISKNSRIALDRIPMLKAALPELDQHALTAAVFSEMFPSIAAQKTVLEMAAYLMSPLPLENSVQNVVAAAMDDARTNGFSIPSQLSAHGKQAIAQIINNEIQEETKAHYCD